MLLNKKNTEALLATVFFELSFPNIPGKNPGHDGKDGREFEVNFRIPVTEVS